jgi:D-3-phosphoglycerate dehydrogenase / 2-oxoglutarate reductase
MLVLHYIDRPGVVGLVGQLLGAAGVNIAGMQVSREEQGGRAVCVLTVDSAVPVELLEPLHAQIPAERVYSVDLD